MSESSIIYLVLASVGLIFIALVGKRAGWFQIISGTNRLLKEQNQELRNSNQLLRDQIEADNKQHELERKEWSDKYHQSKEQIAELRGKIDQTINIPLVKIDESLKLIAETNNNIAENNSKILTVLTKSANIAATDRPTLTGHK